MHSELPTHLDKPRGEICELFEWDVRLNLLQSAQNRGQLDEAIGIAVLAPSRDLFSRAVAGRHDVALIDREWIDTTPIPARRRTFGVRLR